jgi:SNF2 family DNA or RNA helicase
LWLAQRQPPNQPLRVLVVCPKSVVGNWQTETERFTPGLAVVRFSNTRPGSDPLLPADRPAILVANYTQLRLQADFFQRQTWHAVVLDEAQFIKNPSSKVAQAARALPGEHRLVLTGTPVENRLLDLWSLFGFALPGLLGSQASFKRLYSPDDPLALSRLRARVRHFLLRRTKAQVASDLPPRTEEDVMVELEGDQARLYQAELKRARAQLLGVQTARQFDQSRLNILASLLRLRQICCHPALIGAAPPEAPAAKMEALLERVEELREEGHQVLVFSQFVSVLELIAPRLTEAGIEYLLLTGQTEERDALVARFQAERNRTVFLLSLKAAGFGLNLTAASYVILFDPWWNPAVEAQAIDRTHRIGQTQPVNAYRFIARGTVEEKIRALQREKAALASSVVQEESLARVLDLDSLRQILS